MGAVTCAVVLAVVMLSSNRGAAAAAGVVTAQRDAPSSESRNDAQSPAPVPSYIEADRSPVEQALGPALTREVFSDRFTALRKQLVSTSLGANPAPGCERPPAFTLEVVDPVQASADASAWQERYLIKCKPDVRRTFLFVSTKNGVKTAELAPGGTITDMTLQRDELQGKWSGCPTGARTYACATRA
jgi:hypothetical protein